MAKIKEFIKTLIPPVILSSFNLFKNKKAEKGEVNIWSGNYPSWEDAKANCTGYGSHKILEHCKTALLRVKNGDAVYERDSVTFDEVQYSWGLLAGLQHAALENRGNLCVLDFGGSLGSSYYQNRNFLHTLDNLTWCVVEQNDFVECGKKHFENGHLKFYYNVDECLLNNKPDVILLSSVLQYLEKPYEWIEKFISLGIKNIIIDRTAFIAGAEDILTVQTVPQNIYSATYPAWFFGTGMLEQFGDKYNLVATFDNGFTEPIILNQKSKAYWNGIMFVLKN